MLVFSTYGTDNPIDGVPMSLRQTFLHKQDAIDFIESQPDAYGRKRTWKNDRYGDWEIRPLEVIESLDGLPAAEENAARRRAAQTGRSKLTDDELAAILAEHRP